MSRPRLLPGLLVLATLWGCGEGRLEFRGRNVVIISIDTLRRDALGIYGEERPVSPVLDAFASESVRFERALSQSCVTAPSHMSLLTSLYPSVHQIDNWSFVAGERGQEKYARKALRADVPTLASLLHEEGYRTGAFVGGGNLCREMGFDTGFDTFDDSARNGMNGNREILFDSARVEEWLDAEAAGGPFFLFLHTYIPHGPYLPPPPWDTAFSPDYEGPIPSEHAKFYAKSEKSYKERAAAYWASVDTEDPEEMAHLRAQYAGDVRYADDAIERIFRALKEGGFFEDTLIVILSDHGEEFLEHGRLEHKKQLYEELVGVPLLMRLPGGRRGGTVIGEPVGLIDVLPTVLDLVGVERPEDLQGRSLLPALSATDPPAEADAPGPVVSEKILTWNVIEKPGQAVTWKPKDILRSLREGSFTYIHRTEGERVIEELYDRAEDPGETRNLVDRTEHRATLDGFRSALAAHRDRCRKLARSKAGNRSASLSADTVRELEALGYIAPTGE